MAGEAGNLPNSWVLQPTTLERWTRRPTSAQTQALALRAIVLARAGPGC